MATKKMYEAWNELQEKAMWKLINDCGLDPSETLELVNTSRFRTYNGVGIRIPSLTVFHEFALVDSENKAAVICNTFPEKSHTTFYITFTNLSSFPYFLNRYKNGVGRSPQVLEVFN